MTAPKPDVLDAIKALADEMSSAHSHEARAYGFQIAALLAGATSGSETAEAGSGICEVVMCCLPRGHREWPLFCMDATGRELPAPVPTEGGEQP